MKQVRSIIELAVPAWHGDISQADATDIEIVQKCALHIILDDSYSSYNEALVLVDLEMLDERKEKLCLKFARKAEKHGKHEHWFKLTNPTKSRQKIEKHRRIVARTERLKKSPTISYLTDLLNTDRK